MNLQDAFKKCGQILDEERVRPTVRYEIAATVHLGNVLAAQFSPLTERGKHPRTVQAHPEAFTFRSTNFDLLCVLLDQVSESDRLFLLSHPSSRIIDPLSFRHGPGEVLGAGQWRHCSSELPLVAEFAIRRGDKQEFISILYKAAPSPGLTLLLMQLEEMIALNFTLFTEDEYTSVRWAMEGIERKIVELNKGPSPASTLESNTIHHVCKEVPVLCRSVAEEARTAAFLHLKGSLLPGVNLEVNQDKNTVRTFLEKLSFAPLLIQSLDEAERLYRTGATQFELKSGLGHLRSFLEQLHIQACAAINKQRVGPLPTKWGEALIYLVDKAVLTKPEELFAARFYTLMSDAAVHPLIAEREYARLMRNMSIEYGLLLLSKLDKLGL